MADNKIEDALNKAEEILDDVIPTETDSVEKNIPEISYTIDGEIHEGSTFKAIVKIKANDYADTPVKIKGTLSDNIAIAYNGTKIDVDSDGTFWLDEEQLIDTTKEFEVSVDLNADFETVDIRFDIVRIEDSIILNHVELFEKIDSLYGEVSILSGKNCDGGHVFIMENDQQNSEYEFDKILKFPIGSELSINIVKDHYISQKHTLTVTKEPQELTIDLSPVSYKLQIKNSVEADTIDIHVGDNSVHYVDPLTFEYGTKLTVVATKKGYKNYQYIIDSIEKDMIIDIDKMERIKYSLTINSPENSTVIVNGTINSVWPLTFEEGSEVKVSVSKNHYETYTETLVMNEDKVLNISLELEKHTLTITTQPENTLVTLTYNGTEYQARQLEIPYGASVKIKAESVGYATFEKTIVISEDTTENIVLEKQLVTLTVASKKEGILNGATIIVNNIKQQTNKVQVKYGELNNISVMKSGYPTFTTTATCTEDTTIYVDDENEWRKPQVTVNISNKQDIVNPVVITINGNVVSENSPVDIDYNSTANIVVTCDGYKTIAESKQITTDYNPYYELIDVNSDKVKLDVNCLLEGATVTIDGKSATSMYIVPNNTVTVKITHVGYETIIDKFIITENTVKEYSMDMFTPKNFKLTVVTNPIMADVTLTVLDTSITAKTITVPYLTNVYVQAFIPGYISKAEFVEVTKDTTYSITLEEDPNYTGDLSMGEITLEKIIEMIKFRKSYSYLNISQVFRIGGYTNETVYAFYVKFGSYCVSRYDFNLWKMMHTYFGHIENIPHPDTKG